MAGDRISVQQDLFSAENETRVAATHAFESKPAVTQTARPSVVPSKASSAAAIEDAGEELVYNRRNRIKRAKGWNDISHLNDALKVKEAVKSNIWLKPDYEAMINDGMQPVVAHIVKQVYDSVATKPVVRGSLGDAGIQRYISALNRIETGLMQWANDRDAIRAWIELNARHAGAMLGKRISLSELAARPKSLLDAVYPGGWREYREELMIAGGNKVLQTLQPEYDELSRAFKAIKEGWPGKREAWEVQGYRVEQTKAGFEQYEPKGNYLFYVNEKYVRSYDTQEDVEKAIAETKPFGLFGKRGFIDSFDTEAEAVDAARARTQRDKKNGISEKGARVEAVEREGVARRLEGEDISAERLMNEFGFKGVNLGNWMKTPAARAEAQLHLNHAFDSFHDLAEILGLPPKAMSLNGMLGLAIGAQGSGHYAAHFVPGVNEINITRTSGAGSLSHEWAHALDHYFATQAGLATNSVPWLTEHAHREDTMPVFKMEAGRQVATKVPRFGELRPEIVSGFRTIVDAMNKRMETQEEAASVQDRSHERSQKQVRSWLASIRRNFREQEDAFDKLSARVVAGDLGDGKIAVGKAYLSPVVVEMRELYKQKHGYLYSLDDMKSLQSWIDSVEYQKANIQETRAPRKVTSEYAKNAMQLDRDKGGKPYWSTNLEKFARAFDAFVSDSLVERQAMNGYLSHTGREDNTVPTNAERGVINAAFRGLVSEFKVRETEKGPALFSAGHKPASIGLPISAIHAEIDRLRMHWKSMPSVSVVRSPSELPFETPANADGAYWAGKVFVIADNIADIKQLQKVMAHECIMHHSLEEMLGDYGFSKLHHGLQSLKEKGDPTVTALAQNIRERYGVLPPEIETKEMIARAGEQCLDADGNIKIGFGFMKSVFSRISGWLRDLGFRSPFTNLELQGIMHSAGQWIKEEPNQDRGERAAGAPALNSFAGVRAENAPLDALKVAREMHMAGVADRQIWHETGWTFGFADGKPRFEIVDVDAQAVIHGRTMHAIWKEMAQVDASINSVARFIEKYPDNPLSIEARESSGVRAAYEGMQTDDPANAKEITNYLSHDKLYGAYPDVANVKAAQPAGIDGKVNGGNASLVPAMNLVKYSKIESPDNFVSTTLHELQHAIQEREGFASGGSPDQFKELDITDKELKRINGELLKLYEANPMFYRDVVKATQLHLSVVEKFGTTNADVNDPLVKEWWAAIDRRDAHPEANDWFDLKSTEARVTIDRVVLSPVEQYRKLAGEVEARLTQSRLSMSAEERRAVYPLDQMDVPVNEQAVQFGGGPARTVVVDGAYSGKILDVVGDVVVQKTGRGTESVRHSMWRLSEKVEIGDVVDIQYKNGVGAVSGRAVGIEKGR
ncbi:MAG TPA: LPD23 domain-containing protein [Noviherbaspirillum sp.]|nr:LPD23 domain-containing protein [Noviherbaspirillum sp.]